MGPFDGNPLAAELGRRITNHDITVGIIGLGYVGLPLALAASRAGFTVIGFDIDSARARTINEGISPIRNIENGTIRASIESGRFRSTANLDELNLPDAIMICVPTPLSRHREPDLSYIERTGKALAGRLRPGQLVVLESTSYPGTTSEVLRPILESGGLKAGKDFFLAFSPEREDPGNTEFDTATTPRVVGADDPVTTELAVALYSQIVCKVVRVASCATAEAVKLTENIFRAVNIALVNELKVIYRGMGINIWDVIDAAKTKPFGFMPFYPGPGLGGHCIPIDPFYLTWKAREFDVSTRFIELAGEINGQAPRAVVDMLIQALSKHSQKSICGANILLIGMAYKKNIDDTRESPSLRILEMIEAHGAHVEYHDPYIPFVPRTRKHATLAGRKSVDLGKDVLAHFDAVLISTDHDVIDYEALVAQSKLVVDTRNATRNVKTGREKIVLA
jgi:UDP-N-acetyl-D-glucosamine dehydrogenase